MAGLRSKLLVICREKTESVFLQDKNINLTVSRGFFPHVCRLQQAYYWNSNGREREMHRRTRRRSRFGTFRDFKHGVRRKSANPAIIPRLPRDAWKARDTSGPRETPGEVRGERGSPIIESLCLDMRQDSETRTTIIDHWDKQLVHHGKEQAVLRQKNGKR